MEQSTIFYNYLDYYLLVLLLFANVMVMVMPHINLNLRYRVTMISLSHLLLSVHCPRPQLMVTFSQRSIYTWEGRLWGSLQAKVFKVFSSSIGNGSHAYLRSNFYEDRALLSYSNIKRLLEFICDLH